MPAYPRRKRNRRRRPQPYKRKTKTVTTVVRKRARLPSKKIGFPRFVMFNNLVQEKVRTKLVYVDTKTLSPGTGTAVHKFRINSIYDCDQTDIGHQPAYHDNFAALYASYRVLGCKWTIWFRPSRGANYSTLVGTTDVYPYVDTSHFNMSRNPGIVYYEASDDGVGKFTEAADLNFLREVGKSMAQVNYRMTDGNPYRTYRLSGRSSIKRLLDDPSKYHDSTAIGNNPTDIAYLNVGVMSKDTGTCADYRFDIRLEFIVEFSDLKDQDEN